MKTFDHIKDRHFPEGYPQSMQIAIDNVVAEFLQKIGERYKLEEIKTVFDIGSLNGIESVKFTEKLESANVYTFEPNEESYNNVLISTEDNQRITVSKLAVSDFNGKSDFYITYDNMGGSSLLEPMLLNKTGWNNVKTEADVVRLDDWCSNNKIESIDLMWMDTQGSELNIFKGMGDILNTVKGIYVESSNIPYYHGAANKNDVINYLSQYGLELISESYHDQYEGDFTFIRK